MGKPYLISFTCIMTSALSLYQLLNRSLFLTRHYTQSDKQHVDMTSTSLTSDITSNIELLPFDAPHHRWFFVVATMSRQVFVSVIQVWSKWPHSSPNQRQGDVKSVNIPDETANWRAQTHDSHTLTIILLATDIEIAKYSICRRNYVWRFPFSPDSNRIRISLAMSNS